MTTQELKELGIVDERSAEDKKRHAESDAIMCKALEQIRILADRNAVMRLRTVRNHLNMCMDACIDPLLQPKGKSNAVPSAH